MKILWCVCAALAVMTPVTPVPLDRCETCTHSARTLLDTLVRVLEQDQLFRGFNCSDVTPLTRPSSRTPAACQPAGHAPTVTCSRDRRGAFSAAECVRSISEDLLDYTQLLEDYTLGPAHLRPLISDATQLRSCLSCGAPPTEQPLPQWKVWMGRSNSSFADRLSLCKVVKGFYVRTLTINRALHHWQQQRMTSSPCTAPAPA